MSYLTGNPADPFVFDFDTTKNLGAELHDEYVKADPFPHTVIDNFLPQHVLDYCIEHFPGVDVEFSQDSLQFNRDQERFKRNIHPDHLEPKLRSLFYAFNSRPFIKIIENITGIRGLIPDPYFVGAGFHETRTGGHLSMHADFNHHKLMNLERRVNMLIYLNENWTEECGGQLELWRPDMSERVQSIVPLANRCALFSTSEESMHGHPIPVSHPADEPRRSIALYYYTATWDDMRHSHTTQFKARPGTGDNTDWAVRTDEMLKEYLPPFMSRPLLRVKRRHRQAKE